MGPLLLLALAAAAGPGPASPSVETAPACGRSADCVREVGYGSVCGGGRCAPYMDGRDLLEVIKLKKSRGVLEPWKLYPSIIPSVGYTPQNGFLLGITTLTGVYLGDPSTTTISNLALIGFYTSKHQTILMSRHVRLLAENAWQLQGDYRFFLTNQPTYGLGSGRASEFGVSVGGAGTT